MFFSFFPDKSKSQPDEDRLNYLLNYVLHFDIIVVIVNFPGYWSILVGWASVCRPHDKQTGPRRFVEGSSMVNQTGHMREANACALRARPDGPHSLPRRSLFNSLSFLLEHLPAGAEYYNKLDAATWVFGLLGRIYSSFFILFFFIFFFPLWLYFFSLYFFFFFFCGSCLLFSSLRRGTEFSRKTLRNGFMVSWLTECGLHSHDSLWAVSIWPSRGSNLGYFRSWL